MSDHDSSYKLLFSHPEMVRDLLQGFVHEGWVARVDFTTLERVNGSYVGDDLRDREDDVIWRVKLTNTWLYIYLLLEFQATVDPFMPVRMTDYVVSLYQDLRKAEQLTDKKLPPIVPIVLYNGSAPWTAPLEIREMIAPVPGLEHYQVGMRYLLLDENTLAESQLEPLRNLAAALFQLEKSRSPEDLREVVRLLVEWLKAPEQASLRRAFTVWLRRVLLPKRMMEINIPEMTDLHEVNTMLAERVQEWTKPWREEGRLEGRQEQLLFLLQARFNPVPPWVEAKIKTASLDELTLWISRFLNASSIDDVFGNNLLQ